MQYCYGCIKFKDKVHEICFVLSQMAKVLHNKSVNAIPSLCIHKLSQNFNSKIRDCFYDEGIAQNHAFRLLP